jgi:hypothetical protein
MLKKLCALLVTLKHFRSRLPTGFVLVCEPFLPPPLIRKSIKPSYVQEKVAQAFPPYGLSNLFHDDCLLLKFFAALKVLSSEF